MSSKITVSKAKEILGKMAENIPNKTIQEEINTAEMLSAMLLSVCNKMTIKEKNNFK